MEEGAWLEVEEDGFASGDGKERRWRWEKWVPGGKKIWRCDGIGGTGAGKKMMTHLSFHFAYRGARRKYGGERKISLSFRG